MKAELDDLFESILDVQLDDVSRQVQYTSDQETNYDRTCGNP